MAELWDFRDENGRAVGGTVQRGLGNQPQTPFPEGRFHLVAIACVCAPGGRLLITRRAPGKFFALSWEFPGGSALAGEGSLQAALRETKEEIGLVLFPKEGRLYCRYRVGNVSFDVWLFSRAVTLEGLTLQKGETCDVRLAGMGEIRAMVADGSFLPPPRARALL